MKIFYDEAFLQRYSGDPAAQTGRLDHALSLVRGKYKLLAPAPCTEEDLLRVHLHYHVAEIRRDERVYPVAVLAAGAAIAAAESALEGEAAFALCRPPGHHASPGSCWGFCYFNNVAVAVRKVLATNENIKKILIVDYDLHFGDGTENTFLGDSSVSYYHGSGGNRAAFVDNLRQRLQQEKNVDMVAVSAGFDRHAEDWGGLLTTEDYGTMGEILGSYADEYCDSRIFAALEGGYNHRSLGDGLYAFLEGLEGK